MRSVVVVLPASMWAMIPMLRTFSSWVVLAIQFLEGRIYPPPTFLLPPVMRESLVGFRHAMDVVLLFNSAAAQISGVIQFVRQLFGHALFGPAARVDQDPANRQAGPAIVGHLHRHLVVGAAHAPRLDFKQRPAVFDRLLEQLQRVV